MTSTLRGYRVKQTIFIPADPKDLDATSKAIAYAQSRKAVGESAPEGTTVEDFSFASARKEVPDAPNLPETHTIERVGPPTPKPETPPPPANGDAGQIPDSLRR